MTMSTYQFLLDGFNASLCLLHILTLAGDHDSVALASLVGQVDAGVRLITNLSKQQNR